MVAQIWKNNVLFQSTENSFHCINWKKIDRIFVWKFPEGTQRKRIFSKLKNFSFKKSALCNILLLNALSLVLLVMVLGRRYVNSLFKLFSRNRVVKCSWDIGILDFCMISIKYKSIKKFKISKLLIRFFNHMMFKIHIRAKNMSISMYTLPLTRNHTRHLNPFVMQLSSNCLLITLQFSRLADDVNNWLANLMPFIKIFKGLLLILAVYWTTEIEIWYYLEYKMYEKSDFYHYCKIVL